VINGSGHAVLAEILYLHGRCWTLALVVSTRWLNPYGFLANLLFVVIFSYVAIRFSRFGKSRPDDSSV
jgi:hypothetical protein